MSLHNPHFPPPQQHHSVQKILCQPQMITAITALLFNFIVTMCIVFVNKLLFVETSFPVMSLSAAHMIVCVMFTTICQRIGYFERRKMDQKNLIVLVAFLQSAAIALGQASLKMNSVAFFQLTKQMQVPLVAIVEFFFIGRVVSVDKCLLLVVMVLGVSVACFNDVQFSAVGAFVAMIGVMSTSVEVVLYSWLQQSQRWETLQLLHQTMPFAASGLIIAAIEVDFLQPRGLGLWNIVLNVLEAFYSLNNNNNNSKNSLVVSGGDHEVGRHHSAELAISQTFFNVTKMSSYATFLFVLSCVLGMLVNVSSCFVGGKASALAYAMLGLTKTITVIYIGVLYFDAPPSLRVIAGGFFAVCAIVVYSIVTIREKQSLQQQKNDGDDMNDVLLLTDEIEVGIEPATISPKMSNHGQRKHGSLRSF